ncbi:MAG TPA: DMT family transporter [Anaerolineales bacterium]|nr:DMT family transporter [Anaerolineales bacterium]
MPPLAIALLLSSAVLHALWNLLLKQSEQKYMVMAWQIILSGGFALAGLFFTGLPPRSMWLFAIASGTLEALYFGLLTFAYNDHDFSLVYPVARGAAPALVVIWTALFLHEIPSIGGLAGIGLIVCGLVIIGATSLFQNGSTRPQFRGVGAALGVAFIISLYTLVDGAAVKRGPALPYGLSFFVLMPMLTTPFVVRHYGWPPLMRNFRAQPARLLLVGFIAVVAYLFALFAYSIAPVNYSEAIREVSVVMGAFAGWYFLGEQMGKIRILGAFAILVGILMIAVLG